MLPVILAAWSVAGAVLAAQTVDGHVVNSVNGVDIPGVRVVLLQGGRIAYSATTDTEGRFRIEAVKDGAYTAGYRARGFRDIPGFLDVAGQPTFQVTAGSAPVRLEAKMQPLPKISGRVLDAAGKPVPNAAIWVHGNVRGCNEPKCFALLKQSQTGEKGDYTIADVDDPGPILVSAAPPLSWEPPHSGDDRRLGWAQTFYPGAADPQLGARIQVQPGGELSNLDIELATVPVHRIRGRVLDEGGDPVPKASVTLYNGFGPSLDQVTGNEGTFEFAPVADAEWRLSAKLDRNGVKLWAAESVQIKDRDLENVELRITPPFLLRGRMVFDRPEGVPAPEDDLPNLTAGYTAGEFGGDQTCPVIPIGHPDAKGDFTIQVYAGPHHIDIIEPPPGQFYLDSVRLGSLDALTSDVAILSDAQPLTVTYKFGGGTVQGTIEACGAGRVTLLPQDPALRRHEFVRENACGPSGQFQFSAVRPGDYYGFAISGDSSAGWYPAVLDGSLLQDATKVTVRANEHTSADIRLLKW